MAGSILQNVCRISTLILAVVIVAVILRTLTLHQRTLDAPECKPFDTDFITGDKTLLDRFLTALQIQTISRAADDYNVEALLTIQEHIANSYPTIHNSHLVHREIIANYSLLYEIQGSNSSLKPYMLTGHLDVVPITDEVWEAPPFGGEIHNGFIYGRGTIDNKQTVFGILEALEFLLKQGHIPQRTFYLGFGHDEEVGGGDGAYHIAETLMARGLEMEFLVDEGMAIITGTIPGIATPVALVGSSEKGRLTVRVSVTTSGGHSSMPGKESSIGILSEAIIRVGSSEKGYLSLELSVRSPGGHSSMPHQTSSIGILSQALIRLEANPHPSMFGTGPEKGTFEHLAPKMDPMFRVLMSNLWLFGPVVSRFMSQKASTNAIVRTTTAVTKFNAGIKDNVIAPYAEAIVNHRIHPAQTVQEVLEYDRQIINDDRVKITIKESMEPLPQSPYGDQYFGWQMIKTSILQVWGHYGTIVAPSVMIGNTDTRHYTGITNNIYRFSPTFMYPDDLPRFHGLNERISIKNYEEAVNFFYHLMMNADKAALEPMHTHNDEF